MSPDKKVKRNESIFYSVSLEKALKSKQSNSSSDKRLKKHTHGTFTERELHKFLVKKEHDHKILQTKLEDQSRNEIKKNLLSKKVGKSF